MLEFLKELISNPIFKVLCIIIILDTIFGVLRAIRERDTNSAVGIDGIIRKVGMLTSVLFLALIDYVINLNLIGFIPESIRSYMQVDKIGIATLFNLLFILFEALSVLKNMVKCKLPIPKKLQDFLKKALKEYTSEIKKGE